MLFYITGFTSQIHQIHHRYITDTFSNTPLIQLWYTTNTTQIHYKPAWYARYRTDTSANTPQIHLIHWRHAPIQDKYNADTPQIRTKGARYSWYSTCNSTCDTLYLHVLALSLVSVYLYVLVVSGVTLRLCSILYQSVSERIRRIRTNTADAKWPPRGPEWRPRCLSPRFRACSGLFSVVKIFEADRDTDWYRLIHTNLY